MVCMQRELSRPPTFFNHIPDACLFGLGGLAFVAAWLWPGAVVFPTVLVGRYCRDWCGVDIDCSDHECVASGADVDKSD